MHKGILIAAAAAFGCAFIAPAQAESARNIVSLYHCAPGQQVAFLHWLDSQNRVAAAAGIAPGQLYVHTDGDSWDYMVIYPQTTPAQDNAIEAAGKKMGIEAGPHSSLDLRKVIASHTDTLVRGPMSPSDYLAFVGEK
jgi:hypothetical protein